MNFRFAIRDDINVRTKSLVYSEYKDYSKEDIGRAVAYYLDLIMYSKYEKIAVGFGNLSLLSVAFMLALHKSGKEYTMVYHNGTFNFDDYKHLYSHLFFTGVPNEDGVAKLDSILSNDPTCITLTDTKNMEISAFSYYKCDDLVFDYSKNKKVNIVGIIEANDITLLYTTEKIEGSSIAAAMKNYFIEDDYVVMMRPFSHIGVGTLSIYPAFFKVKNISICPFPADWPSEYHKATHIHIDKQMMNFGCELPKKLRMLTSGGYNFNSECVEYVTSRSEIENIVDCFGTARCPPPLAIRHTLTDTSFKWINEFVKLKKKEGTDQLMFSAVDDNVFNELPGSFRNNIVTEDTIELLDNGTRFKLTGKLILKIRMAHVLYELGDFQKLFTERSGIPLSEIKFEVIDGLKNPILYVKESDFELATEAMSKFNVEAKLKVK
jgi:hypothetical protein